MSVLKGLDTCPSGAPNYTQGIRYSAKFAGADWDIAARDCATKGLRLPDLGEEPSGDRAERRQRLQPDCDDRQGGSGRVRLCPERDEPSVVGTV
jgi:hypothetical protein